MKLQETEGGYLFDCPGCTMIHIVYTTAEGRPHWSFNDDINKPTFSPSIAVHWTENDAPRCCHSFITDGRIQFCSDSTHKLAGQTVDLPDWGLL